MKLILRVKNNSLKYTSDRKRLIQDKINVHIKKNPYIKTKKYVYKKLHNQISPYGFRRL